jgi:putative restriction endonuclease
MCQDASDIQLRQTAFDRVNRLATLRGGVLDAADLAGGFEFGGERIPLINPRRGIFKPRQMAHLLSIKSVFPRRALGSGIMTSTRSATNLGW